MDAKDVKLAADAADAAFSESVKHAVSEYLGGLVDAAGDEKEKAGSRARLENALRTYAEGRRISVDVVAKLFTATASIS
jgi:hypothetical protein